MMAATAPATTQRSVRGCPDAFSLAGMPTRRPTAAANRNRIGLQVRSAPSFPSQADVKFHIQKKCRERFFISLSITPRVSGLAG